MEELDKVGLKMFFDEEIYIIPESEKKDTFKEVKTVEHKQLEPSIVEEPKAEPLKLSYKGGNVKGIALIINDDINEFLNTRDETLLLNILKAIGLSIDDVAIINQHTSGTDWESQVEFTKAIVFGILPSTYGLETANYKLLQQGDTQWLFSDSLFSLGKDKSLKGALWGKLQELF